MVEIRHLKAGEGIPADVDGIVLVYRRAAGSSA
ncbi:hypothetical protein OPKNFCMD_2278 [Methylobacterium crusticola]|uniref:Uncharacterized protein n=1 Tax=Methylobacterium crusticola TaxID=1697972 RepID=A0ABQ4QWI3_9HYPH|nr:hypothetical protein OPKNFCMD_2278 [Methylobacterium crusticola]